MHSVEGSVICGAATETPQDPTPLPVGLGTGDLERRQKNEEPVLGSQLLIGVPRKIRRANFPSECLAAERNI